MIYENISSDGCKKGFLKKYLLGQHENEHKQYELAQEDVNEQMLEEQQVKDKEEQQENKVRKILTSDPLKQYLVDNKTLGFFDKKQQEENIKKENDETASLNGNLESQATLHDLLTFFEANSE